MIVEMHILQHFAPSNLNRDDTGAPKDCEFGGVRRARISSQALKRAIRIAFAKNALVPEARRALRTKRLTEEIARRFVQAGKPDDASTLAAGRLLQQLGLEITDGQTEYLVFLGRDEIQRLVDVGLAHWQVLLGQGGGDGTGKQRTNKSTAPALKEQLGKAMDGSVAADLALFGRMLANLPERNVDAASQVAHAISTHRVSTDFDYFTAVDDLQPAGASWAGMIGTVEFNSACYYRYLNCDVRQLSHNLGGDAELTSATLRAWLEAAIEAIPTGKQNSMAAHNPPSFMLGVVRSRGTWNLANAFAKPVRPTSEADLVSASIVALDRYWAAITAMYGTEGIRHVVAAGVDLPELQALGAHVVPGVGALQQACLSHVQEALSA